MADQGQEATDGVVFSQDIVDVIKQLKQDSKRARLPRELEWNRSWNLYNNVYDFSRKAEWQSKSWIPRVNTSVRAGAFLLKRGLVGPKDFFVTTGNGEISELLAPTVHKLTKHYLERGNFVKNYMTALISGMLSSIVTLKVYPKMITEEDVTIDLKRGAPALPKAPINGSNIIGNLLASDSRIIRRKRKRLIIRYDPISAYDLYPDPFNEGLYKIHETTMDFHLFKDLALKGHFDIDVVNLIHEDFINVEKRVSESAKAGQQFITGSPDMRRRVQLDEFWGTLVDRRGNVLFRNAYAVMVNEKWMAVKPKPNPLATKKDPFISSPVIEKPFSTWHQGFVESVSGIQVALTELTNMILDGNFYSSIKAFELDIDQVYDPNEFHAGIYPGKVFKKRGGGFNTAPMIKDIQLGTFSPQNMDVFALLDREFQNGIGLNEFISPNLSGGRSRTTATEVLQKGEQSSNFFSEVAQVQEEGIINKVLERTYEYSLHYQRDFTDPAMAEILGAENAGRAQSMMDDPEIREYMLASPMKFRAGGLSEIANRAKELEKIMAFMALVGNMAKAVPQILQTVNIGALMKKAISALNWNEDDILNVESPIPPPPPPGGGGGQGPTPTITGGEASGGGPQAVNGNTGFISSQTQGG